jgi:hypothetical protein
MRGGGQMIRGIGAQDVYSRNAVRACKIFTTKTTMMSTWNISEPAAKNWRGAELTLLKNALG